MRRRRRSASGTPCVVSDPSSLPEIVGGDARIVPVDDAQAWAQALGAALRGDDEGRAAQARAGAIARFSWPASARAMQAVYAAAERVFSGARS